MMMWVFRGLFGALTGGFVYATWATATWTVGRITIGAGAGAIGSTYCAGLTGLYTWLERGLNGESYGGLVLLLGMCCICLVMFVNIVSTGGRTAVR